MIFEIGDRVKVTHGEKGWFSILKDRIGKTGEIRELSIETCGIKYEDSKELWCFCKDRIKKVDNQLEFSFMVENKV